MLAEIRLMIGTREARLLMRKGDQEVEDEVWTFERKLSLGEAERLASALFQDAYEMMQYVVHAE